MKYFLLLIAPILCYSQTVWNGPLMTFNKQNYDSPSSENSQDRITDLVWLTRGNRNVLYNAKTESSASAYSSPADTEWAEGNTNNLAGLVFSNFKSAAPQNNGSANILGMVGKNYVWLIFCYKFFNFFYDIQKWDCIHLIVWKHSKFNVFNADELCSLKRFKLQLL